MSLRSLAAIRRRISAVGITMIVIALFCAGGRTIARAQGGRAVNQRPTQASGAPGNAYIRGNHGPDPVKDPTAGERAEVAARVYRAALDRWEQKDSPSHRAAGGPPDLEAPSGLELAERLGCWSLRWQEAQDNAARSLAARYQAMSDHLRRMSALEEGRPARETGRPGEPEPRRLSAEVARFFRPIDRWEIDPIVPGLLRSERPLKPLGVVVTAADQVEIADRVYHTILEDAVDRYLTSSREGVTRREEGAIFDALLAERLGFWSDLWRQSQDAAARGPSSRSPTIPGRSAPVPPAGARRGGPGALTVTSRAHLERMTMLEDGRFVIDALKRAGRSAALPVDMTRFRDFTEVARFFRINAEGRTAGVSRPDGTDTTAASQAAAAGRIYRAILDEAARRYRQEPREGGAPVDVRLVFDARLAERLAAWSVRWARARIRDDPGRAGQFVAVRSHIERMASLEEGRSLREALERAGPPIDGLTASAPPRELADVARFFRLEAVWEMEKIRSR